MRDRNIKMTPGKVGIGSRIARLVALATFFAVFVAAIAQIFIQSLSNLENHKKSLQSTAFALASATADATVENNRSKALASLTAVSRIDDILVATIRNAQGEALATMGQQAYLDDSIFVQTDSNIQMLFKGYLPVSVDIIKGGEVRGKLVILSDIRKLRGQQLFALASTIAVALIAAMLGVLASLPLQRRIVTPIVQMTQSIQNIRVTRDYSTNLPEQKSFDETNVLIKAFNGLMSDIRYRDRSLQDLAYNDPLTGLANRVSFHRTVDDCFNGQSENRSGAVVLMHVQNFRAMNDAFSHSIGDAILMTVAATIKSAIPEDIILARYGGDEFAVLLQKAESQSEVDQNIFINSICIFKTIENWRT